MRTLLWNIVLIGWLAFVADAQATIVSGCEADGGEIPHIVLTFLGVDQTVLATYDSETDPFLQLPSHLQKALPDGAFSVQYDGADRREAYDRSVQLMTLHFRDLGPLKAAHADGEVPNINVTESQPVQLWNGKATYVTMFGTINDAVPDSEACFWFCDIQIEWTAGVDNETTSWGQVKSLYTR